jgi:hypothetical protein
LISNLGKEYERGSGVELQVRERSSGTRRIKRSSSASICIPSHPKSLKAILPRPVLSAAPLSSRVYNAGVDTIVLTQRICTGCRGNYCTLHTATTTIVEDI